MWKRLQRFSSLDPQARRIFLRAVLFLPVISVSLKLRGFRATQNFLPATLASPDRAFKPISAVLRTEAERALISVRMVNAAVRHIWCSSTCLEKSLVLWWLLRRQGIASKIRVGARTAQGNLEAHAWVEHGGAAVNEAHEGRYAPFDQSLCSAQAEPQ